MSSQESKRIAMRISNVSIAVNVLLSALKFIAGILAHSSAMVSDAVHSLSDVLSTFVVMIGIQISSKESDEAHPYGHERFECVASIILATMLAITGAGIGLSGIKVILGGTSELKAPGILALIAAIISIVVKELMFWYTKAGADKIKSGALKADAWHHRTDALSSVGSLLGIGAARLGFPIFDPLASLVICLFIFAAALEIYKDAINKMVDTSIDDEEIGKIENLIYNQDGVCNVDEIRTRIFGSKCYVDVEISADERLNLREAHDIAEQVHDKIEEEFPDIKHVMVHVNPYSPA